MSGTSRKLSEAQATDLTAKFGKWIESGGVKVVGVRCWTHNVDIKDNHGRRQGVMEMTEVKLIVKTPIGTLNECTIHSYAAENLYRASCGDKYALWLLDKTGTAEKPTDK